jgi:hypothetical protein
MVLRVSRRLRSDETATGVARSGRVLLCEMMALKRMWDPCPWATVHDVLVPDHPHRVSRL